MHQTSAVCALLSEWTTPNQENFITFILNPITKNSARCLSYTDLLLPFTFDLSQLKLSFKTDNIKNTERFNFPTRKYSVFFQLKYNLFSMNMYLNSLEFVTKQETLSSLCQTVRAPVHKKQIVFKTGRKI